MSNPTAGVEHPNGKLAEDATAAWGPAIWPLGNLKRHELPTGCRPPQPALPPL